jgi:S-DNA-T family DNA segregation ATPase FtsK/SpoIIIE
MVRSEPVQTNPTTGNASAGDQFADAVAQTLITLVQTVVVGAGLLLWWSVLFPMLSLPTAMSGAITYAYGPLAGGVTAGGWVGVLTGWRLCSPASFHRLVSGRVWKRWRRWSVYRHPWARVCALHGLTTPFNDDVLVPPLAKAKVGYEHDVLRVQMLTGHTLSDWQKQSDAFAHTFGAESVTVTSPQRGWVTLTVHHHDALSHPIAVPAPHVNEAGVVDLTALTVGVTDTGQPWTLRLLGRHVLIGGVTGAGKGSVVWSILTALAPAVRGGVVQLWVVDPKGGMEFAAGAALFTRFSYDTGEHTLALLRDAAQTLTERAARLRGVSRQHVPTVAEPLIVVVVDEAASLTAYITDRKVKTEVEQLLGLILSQGRAVGVSVVACVQDPSKEVLTMRQLFPTRIGLRMAEPSQVPMILGQAARERGALCDLIPDTLPGVGYVTDDTTTTVTRVRAFHVTDPDIATLTRHYRPPAPSAPVADPGARETRTDPDWPFAA